MKRALGYVRKAVEDFNMIQEGDRIAIGVSGGKDSLTLLKALKLYQRFSPVSYHLEAITITMGFDNFDITPVEEFCRELDVPFTVVNTMIGKIIFEERKETLFLCFDAGCSLTLPLNFDVKVVLGPI